MLRGSEVEYGPRKELYTPVLSKREQVLGVHLVWQRDPDGQTTLRQGPLRIAGKIATQRLRHGIAAGLEDAANALQVAHHEPATAELVHGSLHQCAGVQVARLFRNCDLLGKRLRSHHPAESQARV